jgi:hypothetical protein
MTGGVLFSAVIITVTLAFGAVWLV